MSTTRKFYIHPTRAAWLVVTPGKYKARQFRRSASGHWVMIERPAEDAEKWLETRTRFVPSHVQQYG